MIKVDEELIRKLTEKPIILDFHNAQNFADILSVLKDGFGLSEFEVNTQYDVERFLTRIFEHREDAFKNRIAKIIVIGYLYMSKALQKECFKILQLFYKLENTSSNFSYWLEGCNDNSFPEEYYLYRKNIQGLVVLDFEGCKTLGQFHLAIKETFGFPEYYGENWSALWDCLTDIFNEKTHVVIRGFFSMPENLQEYCTKLFEILDRLVQYELNFDYSVDS